MQSPSRQPATEQPAPEAPAPGQPGPDQAVGDASHVLRAAMAMKLCVAATYNRTAMRLAPHILYTRHDEPFVDGVVLEREGKAPRELKLGAFKLAGLSDVRLTAIPFAPMGLFDIATPRYAGTTLFTVKV